MAALRRLKEVRRDAAGAVVLLSANPIHDTGGGQRSAQLALELVERGWVVVFVSHGVVTETVDLGLRYDEPRLLQWSLEEALAPERREALLDLLEGGGFVLTQVPHRSWVPFVAEAAGRGVPTVYDCIDRWASELGRGWYRRSDEAEVGRRSAILSASAPVLVDHVENLTRRETLLLPNAYNDRIFDPAEAAGLPRPPEYPEVGRVALYVGALWGGWMDWRLAREAAEALPETTFVFVGDHRGEGKSLPGNCVFAGLRPQTDLPPFLAHADVAFLPWKADDVTAATSPLKVYEFVAMGLPVVAPELQPLRRIPGVRTEADRTSFVQALGSLERSTLSEAGRSAMERFARESSWSRRVDGLLEAVVRADPSTTPAAGASNPSPVSASRRSRTSAAAGASTGLPPSRPFVSVVIPAYNHSRWIGQALDSVAAQALPAGEVVVVDDGSDDGTADVVEDRSVPGLRLLRQENRGAHHALNRGVRLCRGEWVAILNSDDTYEPERLEHAWGVARQTGAALLFGSVRLVDAEGGPVDPTHPIATWYDEASRWASRAGSLRAALRRHNVAVTTSNFFLHRALWEELGGFRAYRYVHDYDFLLRAMALCPDRVVHEPSLGGVLYRVHAANTISEGDAAQREREAMQADLRRPVGRARRMVTGWLGRRRLDDRLDRSMLLDPVARPAIAPSPVPPRIGLMVEKLDLGGLEEVVALLARALPALGVEASVLCVGSGGAVARRLQASGVPVEVLGGRTGDVVGWARREGVTVVSSHFAPIQAVEALVEAGVPVVETVQNCYAWLDDDGWGAERRRVEAASGIVAVSDTVAGYYARHTGHDPRWIVPNAVHPARGARVPRPFARRVLGLDEKTRVLAFVGRLTEQKNPAGLLEAFAGARNDLSEAVLLLAGPADGSAGMGRLRRRHRDLFASGAIRHLRSPSHVGTVLTAADAYVSASFYEGWSVAASEAAWAGRPLILTETGGSRELAGASEDRGVVAPNPCGDPLGVSLEMVRRPPPAAWKASQDALTLAMKSVLEERDGWREREEAIRSWAREELHPERIAGRYAEILTGLD